tara:strand:+ start:329 stop:490 length:162 start_codon:yes stop_codon:yes gene_type:complete
MEFTEEMLDSIEAVKGVRLPSHWDGRCEQHFKLKQESTKTKTPTSENKTASSS